MPDLTLIVDGLQYTGWERVAVTRSLEAVSGSFELTVSERTPGRQTLLALRPGMSCTVRAGADIVITGHIDTVSPSYDAESHTVSFNGRDRTADLVDCAAIHKSGQWTNTPLLDIVRDLCRPFAIDAAAETDTGKPFAKFKIEEGETAFEAIERACRLRAVLASGDGAGRLLLTRASTRRAGTRLVRGDNILAAAAQYSHRERFATYQVKAQQSTKGWADPSDATAVLGAAADAGISRYRPHIVIADGPMDAADGRKLAEWEARTRAGRARRITVTVQGWRETAGGVLWQPNRLVSVTDDWLGIANTEMLIAGVSWRYGDRGETAVLTCTMPDAFDLIEDRPKEDSGWLS